SHGRIIVTADPVWYVPQGFSPAIRNAGLKSCATSFSVLQMLQLTDSDQAMLNGERGAAARLAMSILVRMAPVYGASTLMDITQAHIDSTLYLGDATLEFAERLPVLWAGDAGAAGVPVRGGGAGGRV